LYRGCRGCMFSLKSRIQEIVKQQLFQKSYEKCFKHILINTFSSAEESLVRRPGKLDGKADNKDC
jgi:hypothetical protein